MEVIKVTEQHEARGVVVNEQDIATLKRRWLVETDLPIDTETEGIEHGEAVILAAPEVALYDPHPHYPRCFARSAEVRPHHGQTIWLVEIAYSSAPMQGQTGDMPSAQNPASPSLPDPEKNQSAPAQNRPPEIRFSRKENKVAGEYDLNGNPFANAVGDMIQGVELDDPLLQIDIKYYSVNLTCAHIQDYWNSINNAPWQGFPKWTLRVENFDYRAVYDTIATGQFGLLYEANVTLLFRRDGWQLKLLNAGKRKRVSTTIQAIIGDDGAPVTEPVPLNADGTQWTSGAFHYLYFDVHHERNFGQLLK